MHTTGFGQLELHRQFCKKMITHKVFSSSSSACCPKNVSFDAHTFAPMLFQDPRNPLQTLTQMHIITCARAAADEPDTCCVARQPAPDCARHERSPPALSICHGTATDTLSGRKGAIQAILSV